MRRYLSSCIIAAVVLTSGCSADGIGRDSVTVRDSAGISIVSSAKPEWSEHNAWRVVPDPSVVIGRVEGEDPYLLDRVTHAVRLSDGRIVIVNGGTQELRFYDPNGRHISSTGGRGEGPGEYQAVSRLYVIPGDSLFVADALGYRFSVLDPQGRVVRTYPVDLGLSAPYGRRNDGRLITLNFADRRLTYALGYVRVPMHLLVYPPDGSRVDTVAVLPGSEEFRVELAGGIANYDPPFSRRQLIFAGADRIYTGTGDRFEIEVRGVDGSIHRLIRAELPLRAVRSEDIDSWKRSRLERASERSRRAVEMVVRDAPVPSTMPAYSTLHADHADNVWIRLYAPEGELESVWHVFDNDGRWLGPVELPAGLRVTEIGAEYVLGIVRDELDVEYVQLHRIEKQS